MQRWGLKMYVNLLCSYIGNPYSAVKEPTKVLKWIVGPTLRPLQG